MTPNMTHAQNIAAPTYTSEWTTGLAWYACASWSSQDGSSYGVPMTRSQISASVRESARVCMPEHTLKDRATHAPNRRGRAS